MEYECPSCGTALNNPSRYLLCPSCGKTYTDEGGFYDFLGDDEPSNDDVVSLFDSISRIYESPLWYPIGMRMATGGESSVGDLIDRVAGKVDRQDPDEVLDVACGTGVFTRRLAQNSEAYGVDASPEMLRRALHNARREGVYLELSRGDAGNLPYTDSSFDAGTCCGALHILPEPADTLEEIGRVVRSDGVLVVTTLIDEGYLSLPFIRDTIRGIYDLKAFGIDDLDEMLDSAGFDRTETVRESSLVTFTARRR